MIISLEHGFIFFKMPRAAGSSTEATFYDALGSADLLVTKLKWRRRLLLTGRHLVQRRPRLVPHVRYREPDGATVRAARLASGHVPLSLLRANDDPRLAGCDPDRLDKIINVRNPYTQEFSRFGIYAVKNGLLDRKTLLERDGRSVVAIRDAFKKLSATKLERFERTRERLASGALDPAALVDPSEDFDRYWLFDEGRPIRFDHVIRYERYEQDLRSVCAHYGLRCEAIAHRNPVMGAGTKVDLVPEYFDDETVAMIQAYRAHTFDAFGYGRDLEGASVAA